MADKLRTGIPVQTSFVDGESPRAAKLNSLSAQLKNASLRLEMVVGDIHGESYPYSLFTTSQLALGYGRNPTTSGALADTPTRTLDIASLGRLIGPAANLNPHMLVATSITEDVPMGVHEFCLRYPPTSLGSISFSDSTVFDVERSNLAVLNADGEYHTDLLGRVYTILPTDGGTVTYAINPQAWAGGNNYQDSSFNVIPDLNQLENGDGCSISGLDADGRRTITLPVCTHHHYNVDGTTIELNDADPTYNQQLRLPKVLTTSWTLDEEIPAGFLYLKNHTTGEIYKTATYYYSTASTLRVGNVDLSSAISNADKFCIVTVGCDITTSIDDLRRKSHHGHDRSYGEPLVPIQSLTGILRRAGNSGVFMPSQIPGNHLPQYLHRDGHDPSLDANANDSNIMRGDLVLGIEGAGAGEHSAAIGNSFKIKFTNNTSHRVPFVYRDADEGLILDGDQGVVLNVWDEADTAGVRIRNAALVAEGGMLTGLGSSGELPTQTCSVRLINQTQSGLYDIDFKTYRLDPTKHKLVGVTILTRVSGTAFWIPCPNPDFGTFSGFKSYFTIAGEDNTGSEFEARIYLDGASWSGQDVDVLATLTYEVII